MEEANDKVTPVWSHLDTRVCLCVRVCGRLRGGKEKVA